MSQILFNTEICRLGADEKKDKTYLEKAAEIIKSGGLVAFPTETVYGLGGNAADPNAASCIYQAKGRPGDNPLIVHIDCPENAERYAYTTPLYYKLAEKFMPGPLTIIMKKKPVIPYEVTGGLDTVAIRCPGSFYARQLIKAAGVPIAAPSANLSGSPSPTSAMHVYNDMKGRIPLILDGGDCEIGLESTVISICSDNGSKGCILLRPGAITEDMLLTVCSHVEISRGVTDPAMVGDKPVSPGMKYKHYSPKAEFILLDAASDLIIYNWLSRKIKNDPSNKMGIFCCEDDADKYSSIGIVPLIYGNKENSCDFSHNFFSLLRQADEKMLDQVFAETVEPKGEYLALYNRMIRAAGCRVIRLADERDE